MCGGVIGTFGPPAPGVFAISLKICFGKMVFSETDLIIDITSSSMKLFLSLAVLLLAGQTAEAKLTVHLVPHTHDDVGWCVL